MSHIQSQEGNTAIIAVIVVALLAVGAYLLITGTGESQPAQPNEEPPDAPATTGPAATNTEPTGSIPPGEELPIRQTFDNKVVYTTDVGLDTEAFKSDCRERGGEFNECGSVCAPDAEMCIEVCAYTCDEIGTSTAETATTTEPATTTGDN